MNRSAVRCDESGGYDVLFWLFYSAVARAPPKDLSRSRRALVTLSWKETERMKGKCQPIYKLKPADMQD